MKNKHKYPQFESFLAAWFHQDFDLAGDTLEDIVSAFRKTVTSADARCVNLEIEALLQAGGQALEHSFSQQFDLDIDPLGFSPSVKVFLESIHACLARPVEPL